MVVWYHRTTERELSSLGLADDALPGSQCRRSGAIGRAKEQR
jgi:hypothetical protein